MLKSSLFPRVTQPFSGDVTSALPWTHKVLILQHRRSLNVSPPLKLTSKWGTLTNNMACCDSKTDLSSVPLVALNMSFRKKLGLYLNPRSAVAADWMALAEAMGFTYLEIKNYETAANPTVKVLEDWQARSTDSTVGKLLSILAEVERNDVLEDLQPILG